MLGFNSMDAGHVLENIVYLELKRRDFEVHVGKNDDVEIDFVATKGKEYYQVCLTALEEETLKRELRTLDVINDHNPKYLLTTDFVPYASYNGIKQLNVFEWLLEKKEL